MDSAGYLAHLRREFAAFQACLDGDLMARVEHCGSWTLYDLADHLGQGNVWAAVAVTDKRGDYEGPAAPRDQVALAGWFGDTCAVLLTALDTDPAASAWTIAPPPTAGFWQRRRCLEALIHRWDAEHSLGISGPVDPALANDEFATNLLKYLPYKRLVTPEELAGALLYLASPASGFVTGEAIAIDGGLLCRV